MNPRISNPLKNISKPNLQLRIKDPQSWDQGSLILVVNHIITGYFGKMNSTLGSVVPLAMFEINSVSNDYKTDISLWKYYVDCIPSDAVEASLIIDIM